MIYYYIVFSLGKSGLVSLANFSTSTPINTIGIAAEKLDTGSSRRVLRGDKQI